MEDRFDKLVVVADRRRVGSQRNVGSVREAAECLIDIHWPRPRGPKSRAAERACLRAHAGEIAPEAARQAFMEAAGEAGILIGEAPVRGGQQTEGSTQGLPAHNERDQPAMSEASRAERGNEPFSPIRDILMVVLLPTVIIMALLAAVVVVFGGL
jgi:hypothetical protein